jgi:hypothetical protein
MKIDSISDSAQRHVFVTITDLATPKAVIRNSDKEDRIDHPRVLVKGRTDHPHVLNERVDLPHVLANGLTDHPHVLVTRTGTSS